MGEMARIHDADVVAGGFSKRVTLYESPEIFEQIQELARSFGRSTASEIRAALRYRVAAHEPD